jgi:hypothetical protein
MNLESGYKVYSAWDGTKILPAQQLITRSTWPCGVLSVFPTPKPAALGMGALAGFPFGLAGRFASGNGQLPSWKYLAKVFRRRI